MGKKSNAKKVKKEGLERVVKIKEEEEKSVTKSVGAPGHQVSRMREIVLQTDGNNIKIVKNETSGNLELIAILNMLLSNLTSPK